jgi:hypothetical protein
MWREEVRRREFAETACVSISTERVKIGTVAATWAGAIPEWLRTQTEHECWGVFAEMG